MKDKEISYTKYFNSCKGVFQGGGCKAIAYVGAYKRAYERGVFFSELAGTSAGAFFAALIAAGAKPSYLENLVHEINFMDFIKNYNKPSFIDKILLKFMRWVTCLEHYKLESYLSFHSITSNYGIFDSYVIEQFVDDCLRELTGLTRTVTFEDLIPNLNIVCADLNFHKVKVWNRELTPKESVAKAVRCSCSIPFFFQPVDRIYVDGGVLSNLPNFIFVSEPDYNRVLNFKLESKSSHQPLNKVTDYLKALADTLVEGACDIQQQLTVNTFDVRINTLDVSAVDFDSMNHDTIDKLILQGESAMDLFIDDELNLNYAVNHITGVIDTREKVYSLVTYISLLPMKEIFISCSDTNWCWQLFLTLLRWIQNKTKIVVLVNKKIREKYKDQEKARRRMLKAMGCLLLEEESVKIKGYFFHEENDSWKAVAYDDQKDKGFSANCYDSRIDSLLIQEWISMFNSKKGNKIQDVYDIKIKPVSEKVIINHLKNEPLYKSASMHFEDLDLGKSVFMNPFISALKYKQIDVMYELYSKSSLDFFRAAAFNFGSSKDSLIGPPVVELYNGKYYVMEGNTRFVYAYRHGLSKLRVLVVEGVTAPIPCDITKTYKISDILISDRHRSGSDRYNNFNYEYYRHIEEYIRPNATYLL